MARPTGEKVEIEFTPGVWTDVSADVRGSRVSVKYGRTSEFSDPAVAELSLELDDLAGNYTVRNAASPYYPNVVPRKRIRWSIQSGAVVLFTGYIKGWPPRFDGPQRYVPITAVDRMSILEGIELLSVAAAEVNALTPALGVYLGDAAGSSSAALAPRTTGLLSRTSLSIRYQGTAGGTLTFGSSIDEAPWLDTWAAFAGHPNGTITDGCPSIRIPYDEVGPGPFAIAIAFKLDSSTSVTDHVLYASKTYAALSAVVSAGVLSVWNGAVPVTAACSSDVLHTLVVSFDGSSLMTVYLDGVSIGTAVAAVGIASTDIYLAGPDQAGRWGGRFQMGMLATFFIATPAMVTAYDNAVRLGCTSEHSGDRVARILGYAGVNWATEGYVMAGKQLMGPAVLGGKSAAEALRDVAVTEGGGAVVYVRPDGKMAFLDRTFRNPGAPVMTIDAEGDLNGDAFQPEYDDANVVNDVTVTREGGLAQQVTDAASIAAFQRSTDSVTVYPATDVAALQLAQDRLSRNAWPALRIPKLAVDLVTATTAGLYAALANLAIGARVRLSGITTTRNGVVLFPLPSIDEYVEGWSIDSDADTFDLSMDVTAADAPARGIWDDTTYGRWQPDPGSMTLQSSITAGATSLAVVTSGSSPTFSTTGGDYPLQIRIDEEVLTVSSAPGGSSSPQTLTVTRGQAGTIAAAHAAGAQITLYPLSTWTL